MLKRQRYICIDGSSRLSGAATAKTLAAVREVPPGLYIPWSQREPGTGRSCFLVGGAGVLPSWLQLQTWTFLHSQGPRMPPCLCRLRGACSCFLASPCSQHPLLFWSKVVAEFGCCCDMARCVCTRGSIDMPTLCCLSPLQTLGTHEHGWEAEGPLKAAPLQVCRHPLAQTTWAPWTT